MRTERREGYLFFGLAGMRAIYAVLAVLLLITVPLTLLIPDTARSRRLGRVSAMLEPRSAPSP